MTPFIVAEVSFTWRDGRPASHEPFRTLGEAFEHVIDVNRQRGYRLHSFSLHQLAAGPSQHFESSLVETIVAVFEQQSKEAEDR